MVVAAELSLNGEEGNCLVQMVSEVLNLIWLKVTLTGLHPKNDQTVLHCQLEMRTNLLLMINLEEAEGF
jgi:hypothetical protein